MMIIEFIGSPGSGKSTIARKLVHSDTRNIFTFQLDNLYSKSWLRRNSIKLFSVVKFICMNLKKSYRLFDFILKTKQNNLIDVLRLTFNNLFIFYNYQKSFKMTSKISVFDEGLIHHLWAIIANAQSDVSKDKYFEISGIDMGEVMVINVKCDIKLIRKRMQLRGHNKRHLIMINRTDKMDNLIDEFRQDTKLKQFLVINNNEQSQLIENLRIIKQSVSM